jgi:hypothetical protein
VRFGANSFSENPFRFIAIQSPAAAKDPTTRRLARSHAIKQAIRAKRELQEKQNAKSSVAAKQVQDKATAVPSVSGTSTLSSTNRLFNLHAVDASRLKTLIKQSE